jgi:hypothetical protein
MFKLYMFKIYIYLEGLILLSSILATFYDLNIMQINIFIKIEWEEIFLQL